MNVHQEHGGPEPRAEPDAAASPHAGRLLGAVFLWTGVVICMAVAAVAGYLSYHAQYEFEFAHDGGNRLAASMFAALADSVIAATSLIALYRAVSGRVAGKITAVNLLFIALSTMLNGFQAQPGGKGLATAVVPPIAFALTYHLVLDQVRDHILINRGGRIEGRSAGELTASLLLWFARLLLSPRSTLADLRRHIMETAPAVPFGRRPPPAPYRARSRAAGTTAQDTPRAALRPVARAGDELAPVDGSALTGRQKAARAREVYLAYRQEGWALDARRLSQLSGYSPRNARRKMLELTQANGLFQATKTGDDTAFAVDVLQRLDALDRPQTPARAAGT